MAKGKYAQWLTDEGLLRLEAWARDGLIDEQIAKNIGIDPTTLYDWKRKYPQIAQSLKKGKEIVDFQVENALLKRALGYKATEIIKERFVDGKPTVIKEITKEIPPDTTAQIFWLKNRKPELWRDKRDMGVKGDIKMNSRYNELSVEELKALAKKCRADGNT